MVLESPGRKMQDLRNDNIGVKKWFVKPVLILFAALMWSCSAPDNNTGTVEDLSRDRAIPYQIWLPDDAARGGKVPLVVVSHGSGGEYANHTWLVNSLVANGFAVAGLNHPANTTRDNTDAGVVSVWQRPHDITVLLDHLLSESRWADVIDAQRIGAAGFSSGGYTVIALVGAIYEAELMTAYCTSEARGKDCELATDYSSVDFRDASASYEDERIKAVFAMAPAVGPAITQVSLSTVETPVFVTAAQDDELVSPEYGAIRYAKHIPSAELYLLPSGGHFIFLECNGITTIVDWLNSEFDLCGTNFNVDRDKVRDGVSTKAVSFFTERLMAVVP